MKIVRVPRRFTQSDWGGTETAILETSKNLRTFGHDVEIVCPNALSTTPHEIIQNIPVTRVPYFYPYWGLSKEAVEQMDKKAGNLFSFSLMRTLKHIPGLDIIHLHTGKRVGGIARHVAQKRRIPYVLSLDGGVYDVPQEEAESWTAPTKGAFEWGKALGWWVGSRRVLDDAAAILCLGEKEQEELEKRFPGKKIVRQYHGVDRERFKAGDGDSFRKCHGISKDAKVLLTVGRIDKQKNQTLAIEVLSELVKTDTNWHWVFIGHITNSGYHQTLVQKIESLGLNGHITLIPGIASDDPRLIDAFHAAEAFVLPSMHEPFGIVILEAWAAGLPVIASRVGGIPSFTEDNKDCMLVPSNDRQALFEACQSLFNSPETMKRLVGEGMKKVEERYSWRRVTKDLEEVYEEAIRENPLRS